MMETILKPQLWLLVIGFAGLSGCTPSGENDPDRGAPAVPSNETSQDFGDHEVHFNAALTDQLSADVAQAYGIVRSKNRAMLNVSVLEKRSGQTATPVAAKTSVRASNLTGQLKPLTLREIREGEAIYYIGEVGVANAETLIFDISVTPEGHNAPYTMRFQRQFFAD